MKGVLSAVFAIAIACFPVPATAQNLTAYALATNVSLDGVVIELDVPPNLDGVSFLIVWTTADGQLTVDTRARAGRHSYEMRQYPRWRGSAQAVAITLPDTPGRLKKPTLSDEIDMFLEPERMAPGTVNFLAGHTLFGWSWDTFLLLTVPIAVLVFARSKKRPIILSVVFGFLVSWTLMDLRNVYDHVAVAYKMEKYDLGMFPLEGLKQFSDRASEMIGPSTWGSGQVDGIFGSYLQYRLAEHRYVPQGVAGPPDFWITRDPNEGQVLWQFANYYLVKKVRP